MKVPEYRRLNRGDIPGMPEKFYVFADHIQEQLDLLSQALAGKLTHENDLAEPIRAFFLKHGIWTSIRLSSLKTSPQEVKVLHANTLITGFAWKKVDQDRIQVRALFEGPPDEAVRTTLEIRG